MSIFDKIEDAKVGQEGNWIRPGRYTARVDGVKMVVKHTGEEFVAIEMTILSVIDDENGTGHKAEEEITHLMKVQNPSFLGSFKQFASVALGCEPDDLGKAEADKITSDEQPLAGIEIAFRARQKPTKKGGQFTLVMYSDVDGDNDE
jgi:hypothetical protein